MTESNNSKNTCLTADPNTTANTRQDIQTKQHKPSAGVKTNMQANRLLSDDGDSPLSDTVFLNKEQDDGQCPKTQ
jgi:hypothetical protein